MRWAYSPKQFGCHSLNHSHVNNGSVVVKVVSFLLSRLRRLLAGQESLLVLLSLLLLTMILSLAFADGKLLTLDGFKEADTTLDNRLTILWLVKSVRSGSRITGQIVLPISTKDESETKESYQIHRSFVFLERMLTRSHRYEIKVK